jgi:polar amino acid transport system ATP-binding protein/sulfate transport system ATP-binding protein
MKYEVKNVIMKIEDVSLAFGKKQILRGVNAQISDIVGHGQVIGLLGPSGIGKTQLFRILAGLQKPTTGIVKITDQGIPVTAGSVGVVAQNYPLFVHRTVISNLMLAAVNAGMSKKDAMEKAMGYLERFKLVDQRNHYPQQLSGGQRQRIAIAQQLLCSEHFLLMDEPFSGLDPIMNDEVCALISEVANLHELNTIIVITHDHRSAIKVADTLWLMGRDEGVPGAYLKYAYDLIDRDLAWHPDISATPQFTTFAREIKEKFKTL